MRVQIKPHRVILRHPEGDPKRKEAYEWAKQNAGRMAMDWGDWHVTSYHHDHHLVYIYRFCKLDTALLFKLTWGGQ